MRPGPRRAFAEVIPLRPALLDLPIAVNGVEAVAPDTTIGGVERVDPYGACVPRELRRNRLWQPGLPSLRDEDAVGRFGKDAGVAAEREAGLGERLMPPSHDIVRTGANRTGDDGLAVQDRPDCDQCQKARPRRDSS